MDDRAAVAHHEEPLGAGEDLGHVRAGLQGQRVLVAQHLRRRAVTHYRLCGRRNFNHLLNWEEMVEGKCWISCLVQC